MNGEEKTPPALWRHTQAFYDMLREQAVEETEPVEGLIWTGYTSHVFRDAAIPVPYYGQVLEVLKRMDCILQIQRGGGTTHSVWAIIGEPTLEAFLQAYEKPKAATRHTELEVVKQEVAAIRTSLGGVDVKQAIADLQKQINTMRDEILKAVMANR